MNTRYLRYSLVAFSLAVIALGGFLACSKKAVEFYEGELTVSLQISAPGDVEVADMFVLTVTAADMDTVRAELEYDGMYLSGDVTVPAGRNRTFILTATDSKLGVIMYRGQAVANVIPGEEVLIDIRLLPVAPMLRISPRGMEVEPIEYFSVVVEAYNLSELLGATFRVAFIGRDLIPVLDSVRLGRNIPEEDAIFLANIEYGDVVNHYAVGVTSVDSTIRLTDSDGHAELAELFFTSPYYSPDTVIETALALSITGLTGPDWTQIPLDDIYTDNGYITISLDMPNDSVVVFPDPELDNLIREQLYIYDVPLYLSDVYPIQSLWGGERGIADLTGISALVNLESLDVSYNSLISDLSPLIGLHRLNMFSAQYNVISDLTPLAGIISIQELDLANNEIINIAPLANLPNLNYLDLSENDFTSIQALVDNPGLDSGDVVWLANVPLDNNSLEVLIPQLQERGVSVYTAYPMK